MSHAIDAVESRESSYFPEELPEYEEETEDFEVDEQLKSDVQKVKNWTGYGLGAFVLVVLSAGVWGGRLINAAEVMNGHLEGIDRKMEQLEKFVEDSRAEGTAMDYRIRALENEVKRLQESADRNSSAIRNMR